MLFGWCSGCAVTIFLRGLGCCRVLGLQFGGGRSGLLRVLVGVRHVV